MLFVLRLLWVGLLGVGIGAATNAQAGTQLFDGSWTVKSFGNECAKADPTPGPHCSGGPTVGSYEFYEAYRIPQGILCNAVQPRCPATSTPTDGLGNFHVLGGSQGQALFCTPWYDWQGGGTNVRPAKGATAQNPNGGPTPPLYRNPLFFTPGGGPNSYSCTGSSTDGFGGPGLVQLGSPAAGRWYAATTGTQKGGFSFAGAPVTAPAGLTKGLRTTGQVGEFANSR